MKAITTNQLKQMATRRMAQAKAQARALWQEMTESELPAGTLALGWLATHTPLDAPEAFLVRILVGYLLIAAGLALGSFALAQTGFRGYRFTRQRVG